VWIAAFIMALGGALAASDRRYRTARAVATAPEVTGAQIG
jgi:cytochrome c biogenesis factor